MRKILLFTILFVFSSTPLFADRYFKDGDIAENRYYDTLGYGIGELPKKGNCPNCVEYESGNVFGTFSSNIISNVHIDDITDPDPIYGLMRLHNIYDEVSVPPYSSIDFIYWSKNMSDTEVNISSIKMFLSRNYSYQGDLTKVVDIEGEYEILPIKYIVWEYPRGGLVKTYEGIGLVNSGEGVSRGIRLDTAYVKSPITFVKWEAEEIEQTVLLRIWVKNNSELILKNISYSHQGFTNMRDFAAYEEYVYEYTIEKGENGSLGYVGVSNPNSRTECIARGEHLESNFVGDSPVVGGIREEGGGYLAYIGSRVKPYGYRFCVNVIPYTLYSEEIILPIEQDEIVEQEEEVEEFIEEGPDDTSKEVVADSFAEVKGIKQLPKTGLGVEQILVVFQILWYYLFRRYIL